MMNHVTNPPAPSGNIFLISLSFLMLLFVLDGVAYATQTLSRSSDELSTPTSALTGEFGNDEPPGLGGQTANTPTPILVPDLFAGSGTSGDSDGRGSEPTQTAVAIPTEVPPARTSSPTPVVTQSPPRASPAETPLEVSISDPADDNPAEEHVEGKNPSDAKERGMGLNQDRTDSLSPPVLLGLLFLLTFAIIIPLWILVVMSIVLAKQLRAGSGPLDRVKSQNVPSPDDAVSGEVLAKVGTSIQSALEEGLGWLKEPVSVKYINAELRNRVDEIADRLSEALSILRSLQEQHSKTRPSNTPPPRETDPQGFSAPELRTIESQTADSLKNLKIEADRLRLTLSHLNEQGALLPSERYNEMAKKEFAAMGRFVQQALIRHLRSSFDDLFSHLKAEIPQSVKYRPLSSPIAPLSEAQTPPAQIKADLVDPDEDCIQPASQDTADLTPPPTQGGHRLLRQLAKCQSRLVSEEFKQRLASQMDRFSDDLKNASGPQSWEDARKFFADMRLVAIEKALRGMNSWTSAEAADLQTVARQLEIVPFWPSPQDPYDPQLHRTLRGHSTGHHVGKVLAAGYKDMRGNVLCQALVIAFS